MNYAETTETNIVDEYHTSSNPNGIGVPSLAAQSALDCLYGVGVNSRNRLDVLIELMRKHNPETAMEIFYHGWADCDDTGWYQNELLMILSEARWWVDFRDFMTKEDLDWYDRLDDEITIYRGSPRNNTLGVSWTTSLRIARQSAKGYRSTTVSDPVITMSKVLKTNVLMATNTRDESEILVDPATLTELKTETPTGKQWPFWKPVLVVSND